MDTGVHLRKLEQESVYDRIRKQWVDKETGVHAQQQYTVPISAAGVRTGRKADVTHVAKIMKTLKNDDGQFVFLPTEWRTAKQISSLFSRLAAAQKQTQAGQGEDGLDVREEDILSWEVSESKERLRESIYDEIDIFHLIQSPMVIVIFVC